MQNKRGVDAIVATVLIIMITVAAVAIVWMFIIPTVKNSLDLSTSEKAELSIETSGGYTTWDEVRKIARVQIKRGNDNVNLTGLDFNFVKQGNSKKNQTSVVPQPNQIKVYEFNLSDFGKPEKVTVAPITSEGVGSVVSESDALQNYNGINPSCDYSAWSVCNSSGFRNKTKLSSSTLDCVGDSVAIEECDYVFRSTGSSSPNLNNVRWYDSGDTANSEKVYYAGGNNYAYWKNLSGDWLITDISDVSGNPSNYFMAKNYPDTITVSGVWPADGLYEISTEEPHYWSGQLWDSRIEKWEVGYYVPDVNVWVITLDYRGPPVMANLYWENTNTTGNIPPKTGWSEELYAGGTYPGVPILSYSIPTEFLGNGAYSGALNMTSI